MKNRVLLALMFVSSFTFAQPGEDELLGVWNNQVQAIIDLDLDGIRNQCNDYVGGEWGYIVGLENLPEEWTVGELIKNAEVIFLEEVRADLKYGDHTMLELVEGENGFEIHLTLYDEVEEDGEIYESATILVYELIEGEWKLSFIYIAG
jgi:hypothetical protein